MLKRATCHPHLHQRSWIDDLSQSTVGSRSHVDQFLEEGVATTQEKLERHSLRLAPKSAITCTD
eukprot:3090824-Pyramimonas_sp.AAC.1